MSEVPSTLLVVQAAVAGRYALERELGRGGMGVVYLARDLALDRPVAIKVLPPALAGISALRERFLREARTAARLSHPHIVPIHSVEEHGDLALFVMGYVDGETLAERIARAGPRPPDEAMRILQEVAWALAYAHRHGVVHRDVKPDNILIERATGRALVADFGIAQAMEAAAQGSDRVAGTRRFMSPEQAAGLPLDGRSDLYSLGVTAWVALTGTPPGTPGAGNLPVPGRLGAILERCLAPDPARRFDSGEELADALGAARGQVVPVAPSITRLREAMTTFGYETGTLASALIVLFAQMVASGAGGRDLFFAVLVYGAIVVAGLLGLRFATLWRQAREVLRDGFTVEDALAVLRRLAPSPRSAGSRWGRVLRWVGVALGGAVGALGWLVVWWWWDAGSRGFLIDALLYGLLTLPPMLAVRAGILRLIRPEEPRRGLWSRLWWKAIEWKVFRPAELGLPSAVGVHPAEPTEVALGAQADALFGELPPALRADLAEVPRLVRRLEARARTLRGQSGPGAGGGGGERLATALTALDGVRLDLLRLRGASAATGGLTADLDAARRLGERVEALLAATRELEEEP